MLDNHRRRSRSPRPVGNSTQDGFVSVSACSQAPGWDHGRCHIGVALLKVAVGPMQLKGEASAQAMTSAWPLGMEQASCLTEAQATEVRQPAARRRAAASGTAQTRQSYQRSAAESRSPSALNESFQPACLGSRIAKVRTASSWLRTVRQHVSSARCSVRIQLWNVMPCTSLQLAHLGAMAQLLGAPVRTAGGQVHAQLDSRHL